MKKDLEQLTFVKGLAEISNEQEKDIETLKEIQSKQTKKIKYLEIIVWLLVVVNILQFVGLI